MPDAPLPRAARAFLQALFDGTEGLIECRAIPDGGRCFVGVGDLDALDPWLRSRRPPMNVYVGIATRRDASSGTQDNCHQLGALWLDVDPHGDAAVLSQASEALAAFPLEPSIMIASGGGLHAYWLLREPLEVATEHDQIVSALHALAEKFHGDPSVCEVARVLRLPSTRNFKYAPPRPVVLELCEPGRRYLLDDLLQFLPDPVDARARGTGQPFRLPDRIERGQRYATLFALARSLKMRGLLRETVRVAVAAENQQRCDPPHNDAEVDRIVSNAFDSPDRPGFEPRDYTDDTPPATSHARVIRLEAPPARAEKPPHVERPPAFEIITPSETFLSKYIRYAGMRTDAPPAAHQLLALGALSAAAGPRPRLGLVTRPDGLPLTLWTLYCVNSAMGRKSTTQDLVLDLLRPLPGMAFFEWEGSPQGLIQRLAEIDGSPLVFPRDELSGLVAQINTGGHLAGLPQLLIRAYDGHPVENRRTKKKGPDGEAHHDIDRAERPFLVLLGASTRDSLLELLTSRHYLNGFLPRFLVHASPAAPQRLQRLTPAIIAARDALIEQLRDVQHLAHPHPLIDIEEPVLEAAWTVEQDWTTRLEASAVRRDIGGALVRRLLESTWKVAGLLAFDLAASARRPVALTKDTYDLAATLARPWLDSALDLAAAAGSSKFERDCAEVLASIPPAWISERDLLRKHRRFRLKDINEVLTALDLQGEIEISSKKTQTGRPEKGWDPRLIRRCV